MLLWQIYVVVFGGSAAVSAAVALAAPSGRRPDPRSGSNVSCESLSVAANTSTIPESSWDSHFHVTDPERYPLLSDAQYTPGVYTVWENAVFERSINCEKVVLVQPSIYGSDNSLLLDSLKAYGPTRARAVVVLDAPIANAARLRDWHALGVRGLRLNIKSKATSESTEQLEKRLRAYAQAIKPLDWVLQIYAPMAVIPSLKPVLMSLGVRIVIDHFGGPAMPSPSATSGDVDPYSLAGFSAMIALLRQGNTWVKISAPYRFSQKASDNLFTDLDPLIKELFKVAPSRLIYASDWPHTRFEGLDIKPWTEHLVQLTGENEDLRRKLFKDNAQDVWGP
ncbi:hypothetical protein HIM_05899 [Hirsutella minnesotensis 3608]|uniref:Amidohydrolase-related domain-containing protein n=1 Tax=Hirsutella minnesotensis 3608 TaxID=1043627 RepID=A0A0F7ZZU3_9HYPO|nr:hypothetical protein HIM_05899 [Hirsutella minnesotensis 3608]